MAMKLVARCKKYAIVIVDYIIHDVIGLLVHCSIIWSG